MISRERRADPSSGIRQNSAGDESRNFGKFRYNAALLLALVCCTGCGGDEETLSTVYGGRRGEAASSVNGLSIFADMLRSAGHQVSSRSNSATSIDDLQTIIWAPDRFEPPTDAERTAVEEWLGGEPDRTFVYVGRDYDAAVAYWQRVAQQAPANDFVAVQRATALAESAHDTARSAMPAKEDCDWFIARRDRPHTRVQQFGGEMADDIDAVAAAVVLQGILDVPADAAESPTDAADETAADDGDEVVEDADDAKYVDEHVYNFDDYTLNFEVLLSAETAAAAGADDPFDEQGGQRPPDGTPIVTRITSPIWGSSQLIIVANGSFLLNLPLVNHQNRKLAGNLIDQFGVPGKAVIWESSTFRGTSAEQQNEWSALTTWPLNLIVLHLAVLGMLYILWRFPIFGHAYTLPPASTSDFAKHIDALGKLMAGTRDEEFARRKLQEYRDRRDM